MRAVGKYIVVKELKLDDKKTEGGLILAESQREDIRYRKAEVLVVGDAVEGLNEKDKIYYDRAAGFNIELDKKVYKIIKEFDVVIVL